MGANTSKRGPLAKKNLFPPQPGHPRAKKGGGGGWGGGGGGIGGTFGIALEM